MESQISENSTLSSCLLYPLNFIYSIFFGIGISDNSITQKSFKFQDKSKSDHIF